MEATLQQVGDVFVCRLSGRMNYQSVDPFQEICLKNLMNRKVIFNLQDLSFVGSIGITQFIDTISRLSTSPLGELKLCGVQTEFRRIFEVNEGVQALQIFEDEQRAHLSFQGYSVTPINSVFLSSLNEMKFIEDSGEVSAQTKSEAMVGPCAAAPSPAEIQNSDCGSDFSPNLRGAHFIEGEPAQTEQVTPVASTAHEKEP